MNAKRRASDVQWADLSTGDRIRHLEVEGYVLLPGLLQTKQIVELKAQTVELETSGVSYSDRQRTCTIPPWFGGAITDLVANRPTITFLETMFGKGMVMMGYTYSRSEPGHPGISLHSDGQPWGSRIFGFEHSCPRLIRCLYYLDDLTPDVSPFRVIPRSHLSFHNDANPYSRYESHPEEIMVTAAAGDVILLNQSVFHGNYPNVGDRPREMLALAYRPAWAGPVESVPTWSDEQVKKCPSEVQELLKDRNLRLWAYDAPDKPAGMPTRAPGISPNRWNLT